MTFPHGKAQRKSWTCEKCGKDIKNKFEIRKHVYKKNYLFGFECMILKFHAYVREDKPQKN